MSLADFINKQTILSIVASLVIVFLTYTWRKRFQGTLPTAGSWIPFIGAALQFAKPPEFLRQCYDSMGENFGIYLFGQQLFFLNSPEGLKFFFTAKEDLISARHAYKFTVPVFGPRVVYDVDSEVLVEQKKFLKDGFTTERFRAYTDMIAHETEEYFKKEWPNKGVGEALESFNQVTVFTSTLCLQGKEVRDKFSKDFADVYNDLDAALSPVGFFYPNAPLPAMLRRDGARKKLADLFKKILEERKLKPEHHEDFIATLTSVTYKAGQTLSEDEVIGLVVALLMAGQHTSNVTSTWLLLMLLNNPDCMAKVMKEQEEVCAGKTWVGYDEIKAMVYLEACMKETLRMHPPLIMLFRKVLADFQFEGKTIPAGSFVGVSPILIHALPRYWDNPDKFMPERHLVEETQKDADKRYAFIGFGAGRHQCSGETFAYLQVKTIMSTLLRRYNLKLQGTGLPIPNYTTMVVSPSPPVNILYERKQD